MKKAKLIQANLKQFCGVAHLYELCPPYGPARYVAVSAANTFDQGPETMVFKCNKTATRVDFTDLACVPYRSHEDALAQIGYKVV